MTAATDPGPERVVESSRFRLVFQPDGQPPGATNLSVWVRHPTPPTGGRAVDGGVIWRPGDEDAHNLGGTAETLDGARGAGSVDIGHGLVSRSGWFLLDDSRSHVLIDGWPHSRHELGLSGNTDWYLFAYGGDYRAAFEALATIAGKVPLPRRYALGSWYSRYWPYTSEDYRGIVSEYERHGFPLDVLVLDMDWHRAGWTGWSWNRELLPDATDLIAWLHERGLAVTLNLHPAEGVGPHEDAYAEFMRALGRHPGPGERVPFDAGDREYMTALFERVLQPLEQPAGNLRAGVDFWWLDWQQDRFVRSKHDLTNVRWLNELFFRHTGAERVGSTEGDPGTSKPRGLSFSRWAGWGDHRHPIHFSGDTHTGWPMLAFIVPFTATAGNVGCFYWSHDIGGHFGPRIEEAAARWVQFGAVSAALRLHSARSKALDRRPWTYEARFCESMRRAFALRAGLMPYIYTAAAQSSRENLPFIRPMYLDRASDERAYGCPGQYLLGADVLAAPIVEPGVGPRCIGTQRVWFPPGQTEWCNWVTGERHAAGEEAIVAANIDEIPLFARAGVPIPMQRPGARSAGPVQTLAVRCHPGQPGQVAERVLYEDDGLSREGRGAMTPLRAAWSAEGAENRVRLDLEIGAASGSFNGQVERRAVTVEVPGAATVSGAFVDAQPVHAQLEADEAGAGNLARVTMPERSSRDPVRVSVIFEPLDGGATGERVRWRHLREAFGTTDALTLKQAVLKQWQAASDINTQRRAQVLAIGGGIGLSRCGIADTSDWRLVDSQGWIDDGRASVQIVDRLGGPGRQERIISESEIVLDGAARGRGATIRLPTHPLDRPPLGERLSRLIRVKFTIERRPIVLESAALTRLTPVRRCLVAGPFDWHWEWAIMERQHSPETEPFDRAQVFAGIDGSRVRWRSGVQSDRLGVDFAKVFDRRALAYARTTLVSARPQRTNLIVADGSDKVAVFLNGQPVFVQDGFDTPTAANSAATVQLRTGRNDLLVKAAESAAGWGFSIHLDGEGSVIDEEPSSGGADAGSPAFAG